MVADHCGQAAWRYVLDISVHEQVLVGDKDHKDEATFAVVFLHFARLRCRRPRLIHHPSISRRPCHNQRRLYDNMYDDSLRFARFDWAHKFRMLLPGSG